MGLTPLVPSPDDLKRTMGPQPPMLSGLGKPMPDSGPPQGGGMPSLGGLPSLPGSGLKPIITSARQQQEQQLQQALQQKPQGFWQNLRHIAGIAGTVAGNIVAPGETALVERGLGKAGIGPEANDFRSRQLAGLQSEDRADQTQFGENTLRTAQAANQTAEAGKSDLATQEMPEQAAAQLAETNARTASLLHPDAKTEFEAWQQQNHGAPISDWLKQKSDAEASGKPAKEPTPQDQAFNDLVKNGKLTPAQAWERMKEKPASAGTGSARADKSFQYSQGELDKIGTPISALVTRMGRLQDTLAQGTPQADALVAPELMTVMAGGQGSGLRINEAEIARTIGGRSKWEALKAAANQWSLDPRTANSITPDQRQQIHELVGLVNSKVQAKQKALDDAAGHLIDTDDPKEHRRIVQDARQALTKVDEGGGQGGGDVVYDDKGVGHRYKGTGSRSDPNSYEAVKQ
jgi:hypothetical protein